MKRIETEVFGEKIAIIQNYEDDIIFKSLEEQFSYYPSLEKNSVFDLTINICENFNHHNVLQINPSTHTEINNGFICEFKSHWVAFYKRDERLNADIVLRSSGNQVLSFVRKFNNIEFAARKERVPTFIFETVILPYLLLFNYSKLIIHSTGVVKGDKAFLIGGTGGCGKTSLELELCLNNEYAFVNDDMGVLSTSGDIFPNLVHPKIYGYNVNENAILKSKLLSEASILDKVHWDFHSKLFGLSKVRRRLIIENFKYLTKPKTLTNYIILLKENVDDVIIEKLTIEQAVHMSLSVILTEYSKIINHVYWHEFNTTSNSKTPLTTMEKVISTWKENSVNLFSKVSLHKIRIPIKIGHSEFLMKTTNLIKDLS